VHLVLFNEWISRIFFSFQLCSRVHGEELARIRLLLCCWMNIALQQLHMFTRRPTLLPLLLLLLCVRVIPVRRSSAFVAINDLFALKIWNFLEVFGVSKSRLTVGVTDCLWRHANLIEYFKIFFSSRSRGDVHQ
jgi:hypothetical protein